MQEIIYIEDIIGKTEKSVVKDRLFDRVIYTSEAGYIHSEVVFTSCDFQKEIHLYSNDFMESVLFENCVFSQIELNFNSFSKKLEFRNCTFKEELKIINCQFYDKVFFINNEYLKGTNFFRLGDALSSGYYNVFTKGAIFT